MYIQSQMQQIRNVGGKTSSKPRVETENNIRADYGLMKNENAGSPRKVNPEVEKYL